MFAVSVPPKAFKDRGENWYDKMMDRFGDDSAYEKEVKHEDGIFWLYDGMSGEYSLIGKVIAKTTDGEHLASSGPMVMPTIELTEEMEILRAIDRNFGMTGELKLYLITHYR